GSVYMIKAKSIQGVDMADAIGKLFKAYKAGNVSEYLVQPEEHKPENVEPEPAEDTGSSSPEPEVSVGAYRYALQMRPAAPGAIPEGNKAILPRPDEGDPYYEYARYGIATYDTPLSDQQMSEYDLKLLPREDS
ncbi:internal head protein, partial [Escherichia coli]